MHSHSSYKLITGSAAALVLASFLLGGCTAPATQQTTGTSYSATGTYFDTVIKITVYEKDDTEYIEDCFTMAEHYENLFSRTVADSDISRINDADGAFVTVDSETVALIEKGLEYCELSEGRFDLTIGTLADLWDITNNPGVIPADDEIQQALTTVDYHNIQIDGDQVALTNPDATLDLGGIAKGYIADQMKDYLEEQGVTSAMINLGGNVLVLGDKPDGTPYKVGIEKPFDTKNVIATLKISDKTVVTSGTYERYFELNNHIYHHILDTDTGYPVDNGLMSVTIICNDSVDGDGLSTSCFALGLDKGMELIESLDDTEAIFITEDYELHCSSGITDDMITINE